MNPFDPDLFAVGTPCLPCCGMAECPCSLPFTSDFFSGGATPFSSYSDAATALANGATCYAITNRGAGGSVSSFTSDASAGNQFDISLTGNPAGGVPGDPIVATFAACVDAVAGSLTVVFAAGAGATVGVAQLYDCTTGLTTPIDTQVGASPLVLTVTTDGIYYVVIVIASNSTTTDTFTISISASSLVANPVIALWDDSGTTRQLWACPKLLLPPLTEATGDWYADCAEAAAIIADQTSNCVGYVDTDSGSITSFTATDGGSSLTLAVILLAPNASSPPSYGSINAEAGETVSVTWTATTATAGRILAFLYDDTGILVDQTAGPIATNPWVTTALPYTGRYTVRVQTIDLVGTQTAYSIVITSSGTLSVNPIQALYDTGLDCPARLDCGDACP